ncbi:tellurium resistance protein terB [Alsobacter metallidurans]|uniref:Tellurium resistance protein terB n=1 Tax=Alsobacter metallidurans TaxID=340221 RepID=A0A917MFW3_9HYPH|nr:TerB family tellurite resistance protein [Alsobacter metallidurans]GGH11409.1 tellurium resistance protein terB [Alsobacter metallidurans]
MPTRHKSLQAAMRDYVHDLNGADAEMVFENVVAGCAIIAYADGWVTPDEERRMLGLILGADALRGFGPADLAHAFEEATARFEADHDGAETKALAAIARLKGRREHADMLMRICCAVAVADGAFDAEERRAAGRICDALGLNPTAFDLRDAA